MSQKFLGKKCLAVLVFIASMTEIPTFLDVLYQRGTVRYCNNFKKDISESHEENKQLQSRYYLIRIQKRFWLFLRKCGNRGFRPKDPP